MNRTDHESSTSHRSDAGATAVEYAIVASLIAAVIAATVFLIGQTVNGMFAPVPGWL